MTVMPSRSRICCIVAVLALAGGLAGCGPRAPAKVVPANPTAEQIREAEETSKSAEADERDAYAPQRPGAKR